jgi:WD40 repeat protein
MESEARGGIRGRGHFPARIVTVNGDGVVRVWDARTGADLLTLEGNTERATTVEWSPDGSRIMAQSMWTVWIWDASPNGPEFLPKPLAPIPRAK